MIGSYLNDPCRELRDGEPDEEPPGERAIKIAAPASEPVKETK